MFLQHPSASLSRALCRPFPEQCGRHAEALSVNRIGLDKKNRAARESGRCWGAEKPQRLPAA